MWDYEASYKGEGLQWVAVRLTLRELKNQTVAGLLV